MEYVSRLYLGSFLVAAVAFAPAAVGAQMTTSVTGEVTGAVDVAVEDVDASTDVHLDVEVEGEVHEHESEGSGDAHGEVHAHEEDHAMEHTADTGVSLEINAAGVTVVSASQVETEADLAVFSANVAVNNDAVSDVRIDSEENTELVVSVSYEHEGEFLGFIPVTVTSTTVVDARADVSEIEVRSQLPWWSFLVTGVSHTQAELESQIRSNAVVQANASVNASAQAQAEIAEAVIAEVAAHAGAHASVEN